MSENNGSTATIREMKKYYRVRSEADARFVEFDFAIDDPGLFVELIMPQAVFEDFRARNDLIEMTPMQIAEIDAEMDKWRYGEETLMRQNHECHEHK